MEIRPADPSHVQVRALLVLHLAGMHADSPPGTVFALDEVGLQHPSVSFFGLWDDEQLLAFGALKEIGNDHGEIKSMRTAPEHLRRGAAALVLEHLLALARDRGYQRVSLETGVGTAFTPATALYLRCGFVFGDAFDSYPDSDFSQFMHLDL